MSRRLQSILYRLMGNPTDPSSIVEPTEGPWKRNFNWGGGFNGPMPVAAGAELPLFSNEQVPGPPRVQSVVLGRSPTSVTAFNADFRARVDYAVGSANDSFECDWTRGCQFTIVANWVRVIAVSYAPESNAPYNPNNASGPAKVIINAGTAEGTVHKDEPITFTSPLLEIPDAGIRFVDVPDFARAVRVNVTGVGAPLPVPSLVTLRIFGGTSPLALLSYDQMVASYPRGLLVPGAALRLQIQNQSGITILAVPQWILGL